MNIGDKSAKSNSQTILDENMSTNSIFDAAAAPKATTAKKVTIQDEDESSFSLGSGSEEANVASLLFANKMRKKAVLDENMTEIPFSVRFRQTWISWNNWKIEQNQLND